MAAMKATTVLTACVALAAGLIGCGGGGGYLVTPVPLEKALKETVVQADPGWVRDKIALIDVTGLIMNARGGFLSTGENPVSLLAEKLEKARADKRVKAVILRLNSPGGTVQATEAMGEMLQRFRRTGKPVIACITDVGASGAYNLACGADMIICQPGSITGSIGVIIQTVSFAGTMKMIGISAEAITSGKLKDMGSPLKDLSDEERKVFQAMVDDFYTRFVAVVVAGRKMDPAKVRKLADGRVYTGRQALEVGLVDKLGFLSEAVKQAKAAAKIGKVKVVMYHRPLGYRANMYSALGGGGGPTMQVNMLNIDLGQMALLRRPSFLYLWTTDIRPTAR